MDLQHLNVDTIIRQSTTPGNGLLIKDNQLLYLYRRASAQKLRLGMTSEVIKQPAAIHNS